MKILLAAFLILSAGSGPCLAEETSARSQNPYDEQAKAQLLRAYRDMEKATEVSVYLLVDDARKVRGAAASFPIRPSFSQVPIAQERILKGEELKNLLAAWLELSRQSGYLNALCHEPVYGLRFRNGEGVVVFETSLCWGCSNYYLAEGDGHTWAALPKSHLAESKLKKQLDSLFGK